MAGRPRKDGARRALLQVRVREVDLARWQRQSRAEGRQLSAVVVRALEAYFTVPQSDDSLRPAPAAAAPVAGVKPVVAALREVLARRHEPEAEPVQLPTRFGGPRGRRFTAQEVRATVRAMVDAGQTPEEILVRFPGQETEVQQVLEALG